MEEYAYVILFSRSMELTCFLDISKNSYLVFHFLCDFGMYGYIDIFFLRVFNKRVIVIFFLQTILLNILYTIMYVFNGIYCCSRKLFSNISIRFHRIEFLCKHNKTIVKDIRDWRYCIFSSL